MKASSSPIRLAGVASSKSRLIGAISCRRFHLTPARLATEVPKDPLADPSVQAFYEKIRNHQGAIDAMMSMRKIMEDKGLIEDQLNACLLI